MLAFNRKCCYGLAAVLSLAAHYHAGLLQTGELAAANRIPRQYLEQICNALGKAKIVTSARGKNGGYRLARPPAAITVLEVVAALEGGIQLAADTSGLPVAVADLLTRCQKALETTLDLTLADLLARQQTLSQHLSFEI